MPSLPSARDVKRCDAIALQPGQPSSIDPLPPRNCFLLDLADEILLKIFLLLPHEDLATSRTLIGLQRVCKRLSRVASDPALWRPLLAHDFEPSLLYPSLFPPHSYGDAVTARYCALRKKGCHVERMIDELARAPAKRQVLLDELCDEAGGYAFGTLDRLSKITPEQDPECWLSVRYWAKLALGITNRASILQDLAFIIQNDSRTGVNRGYECLALAAFSSYVTNDPRQVVHQLAALKLSDLQEFFPLDDMSPRVLLEHFLEAFKVAGYDSRSGEVEPILLHHVLAGECADYQDDPNVPVTPTPASIIIMVEFLLKITSIVDVAILDPNHDTRDQTTRDHSAPWLLTRDLDTSDLLLAVTFQANNEVLFIQLSLASKSMVMTLEEAFSVYPQCPLRTILNSSNLVPREKRLVIDSLLERTEDALHRALLKRLANDGYAPLRPPDIDISIAERQVTVLRLLHTSEDPKAIISHCGISAHSIFERRSLCEVFSPDIFIANASKKTEEMVDRKYPHASNLVPPHFICRIYGCEHVQGEPVEFLSHVREGTRARWFPRGNLFLVEDLEDEDEDERRGPEICVVVGFERLLKKTFVQHDVTYLCLRITPHRWGHIRTAFVPHSVIEAALIPSLSELLDPYLQIGQYFRAISDDGLLIPNAWLDRLSKEADNRERQLSIWHKCKMEYEWSRLRDEDDLYERTEIRFGLPAETEKEKRVVSFGERDWARKRRFETQKLLKLDQEKPSSRHTKGRGKAKNNAKCEKMWDPDELELDWT